MSETAPVVSDGRFVKGQSGNPAGRPPNTKNKLSALRKELELAVIEHVGIPRLKRIINKIAEKAEAGDMRAAKLLLDKVVPNAGPGDEADNNGRTVVFRIENATFAAQHKIEQQKPNSIDVQVTDVTPITPQEST
jgi:hypothetical protein